MSSDSSQSERSLRDMSSYTSQSERSLRDMSSYTSQSERSLRDTSSYTRSGQDSGSSSRMDNKSYRDHQTRKNLDQAPLIYGAAGAGVLGTGAIIGGGIYHFANTSRTPPAYHGNNNTTNTSYSYGSPGKGCTVL